MTRELEPLRLAGDTNDPELAELVGRAQSDVLEPERVERLARTFVGPTSIPPGGGGGVPVSRAWKLTGAALGGLGVILAGAVALSPRSGAKLEHGPSTLPIPAIAASHQEKWLPPPLDLDENPAPAVSRQKPAPSAAPLSSVEEYQLIRAARAALPNDPARALSLAHEHARKFPHGMLVQERKVIEISALRKLGHASEADRESDAFKKAYPSSPHNSKLDQEKVP